MKRIALLVPCYNAAEFVAPFVAMVRAQTRPYDDVLFFDDASTDDTVARLEAHGMKVQRGTENHGAAYARNRLLASASADLVHFHDIDDELAPEFVSTLLPDATIERAACCAFRRRHRDGRIERDDRFLDLPSSGLRIEYFLAHFLHLNAVIYPREVLQRLGGFNDRLRLSEDVHLLLRLAAAGLPFVYHDQVLTTWQLRSNSTHHSAGDRGIALGQFECYADLFFQWNAEQRRELGPTLLELAWCLNEHGESVAARRAAKLAEACGQHVITNRGQRIRWLSTLLGPALYYRFFAPRAPAK